jgi:ATP synthase protein I
MHGVSIGIEFALSVLVGLGAGYWLDKKLGTAPWLMLVGMCFGFTAGLRSMFHYARSSARAEEREAKKRDEDGNGNAPPPSKSPTPGPTDPDA